MQRSASTKYNREMNEEQQHPLDIVFSRWDITAEVCEFLYTLSIYGQILGQTELFNFDMVTGLWEGKRRNQTF